MVIIGQRSSESTFGAYKKIKYANMQLIKIQIQMKSVWLSGMEETDWQWAASSPLPPIHQRRNNNPSSMQHKYKYKYKINTNTKT